jgi:putative transposase
MAIEITPQKQNNLLTCPHCNSTGIVKFGTYKGAQRYWCKACQKKFKSDGTLFHMKTPANQVASALNMYYEGMSIKAIRRQLQQDHANSPSTATIYEWIQKYTQYATDSAKGYHPKVGDTWVADETAIKIDGQNIWFWDIIDDKTRYLLASRISTSRTTRDAQILMDKAVKTAGKKPKAVVTDKLASYLDVSYGKDTEHKQGSPFNIETNSNLIERFHGTLKARTKVMRGLKNIETAIEFTDGWLVHYNYLRPHEALNDKTPAEVAEIDYTYKNWSDISRYHKPSVKIEVSHVARGTMKLPKVRIGRPRKIRTSNTGLGKIHHARLGGGLTRRMDR